MITLNPTKISSIRKIIHIADVHIRNYIRSDEYAHVFSNLYSICNEIYREEPNTLIYLAGDIVHSKTDMSPELIRDTYTFLTGLLDIGTVLMIPGNHDMNIKNPTRLDALSPIVSAIDSSDLFYVKDTGVYRMLNVDFIHNAVFDDVENFVDMTQLDGDNTKIVLFHGPIEMATTDIGMTLTHCKVSTDTFNGVDYGMFGDIHKFQYLNASANFAYPGSLIQQNFGEGNSHGIIVWDLIKQTSNFIEVKNDWGYHTIVVSDGVVTEKPRRFSKFNRLRIKSHNTPNNKLTEIISDLKETIVVEDIRVQKINTNSSSTDTPSSFVDRYNVRDVQKQNSLIEEFLRSNGNEDELILEEIFNVNESLNKRLENSDSVRNAVWKPVMFTFDNMFSYGEGNLINFDSMSGTYGIFAPNASGKSSVFDAMLFCLFDKCSRTFKASQVLNNSSESFSSRFQFKIADKNYFVERTGIKDKKGHVKVDVRFWSELNGVEESLSGVDRDSTNSNIRKYIGTYDDFIITVMSLQINNANFIDKDQKDRKDLMSQFLDLEVFDSLNKIIAEDIKEVKAVIKDLSRINYLDNIKTATSLIEDRENQLHDLTDKREKITAIVDGIDVELIGNKSKLRDVSFNWASFDIESVTNEIQVLENRLSNKRIAIESYQEKLHQMESQLATVRGELSDIDISLVETRRESLKKLQKSLVEIEKKLVSINLKGKTAKQKIDSLRDHKYDPNCEFCTANVFVQDALRATKEFEELKEQSKKLKSQLESISKQIADFGDVDLDWKRYYEKNTHEKNILSEISTIQRNVLSAREEMQRITDSVDLMKTNVREYQEYHLDIEHNKVVQDTIRDLESKLSIVVASRNSVDAKIQTVTSEVSRFTFEIEENTASLNRLKDMEKRYRIYELYSSAVGRNGIPYRLIVNSLPKIQDEVNSILSQLVPFQVLFETDGKYIHVYIVYDDKNYWPLDMSSGMERFLSSLAIRVALINTTSLPRPNFICIDEGFGSLDSKNRGSLSAFFEYLKTQFDYVFIVSHLDSMRDLVDNIIDINRIDNKSEIVVE
jgi:DNA repair exonuclease SbcCD ATPase subunit